MSEAKNSVMMYTAATDEWLPTFIHQVGNVPLLVDAKDKSYGKYGMPPQYIAGLDYLKGRDVMGDPRDDDWFDVAEFILSHPDAVKAYHAYID